MAHCSITGSHGCLTVHQATGLILDRAPGEYDDILRFDPKTLTHSHLDILGTAYWTNTGHYEPIAC